MSTNKTRDEIQCTLEKLFGEGRWDWSIQTMEGDDLMRLDDATLEEAKAQAKRLGQETNQRIYLEPNAAYIYVDP